MTNGSRTRIVCISVPGIMVSFGSLVIFSFGAFVKPLSERFGWTRGQISLAFTLTALMVAIFSPLIGRLIDRVGVRRVLLPAVAIYCAAFASLSAVTSLAALYAAYTVMGIVGNATAHLAWARVIAMSFEQRRGLALATTMTGAGAGAICIPPLTTWLIASLGWSQACLVLAGAIFVLGFLPPLFFLPDLRASSGSSQSAAVSIRSAARGTLFWSLMAAFFLFSIGINGVIAHLIPLLSDRGLSASSAAFAASTLGALSLCGRVLAGALLDRFPGARIGALFFGISALGVAAVSQAGSLPAAYGAAGLIGLGMGAEADVMPYLISRYFPLHLFGEIYGYSFTAYALAAAFGPLAMGSGFDRLHSYTIPAVVLASAMLVASVIIGSLPGYDHMTSVSESRVPAAT